MDYLVIAFKNAKKVLKLAETYHIDIRFAGIPENIILKEEIEAQSEYILNDAMFGAFDREKAEEEANDIYLGGIIEETDCDFFKEISKTDCDCDDGMNFYDSDSFLDYSTPITAGTNKDMFAMLYLLKEQNIKHDYLSLYALAIKSCAADRRNVCKHVMEAVEKTPVSNNDINKVFTRISEKVSHVAGKYAEYAEEETV